MKKNDFVCGLVFLAIAAIIILSINLFNITEGQQMFTGSAGAFIISGCYMLIHYFYWTKLVDKNVYVKKLDDEAINYGDERNQRLIGISIIAMGIFKQLNLLIIPSSIILFFDDSFFTRFYIKAHYLYIFKPKIYTLIAFGLL